MPGARQHSYIRGAAADGIDGQRVVTVVAAAVLVIMLAVTAYLFSSTASANESAQDLARSGMVVAATVTGCEGISDGVGMGIEYYNCTAAVTAGGRTYEGLLHGSRRSRPTGSRVEAVMVPGDISTLTVDRPGTESYLSASIMAAVSVVLLVLLLVFLRGRRLRRQRVVSG
jgi:uncharacterized membrane protein